MNLSKTAILFTQISSLAFSIQCSTS